MKGDLLEQATRALRHGTEPHEVGQEEMLRRILRSGKKVSFSRQRLRIWAWTVAAMFLGVGAWASATGSLRSWLASPAAVEADEPAAQLAKRPKARAVHPHEAALPSAPSPPPAPAVEEPAPAAAAPAPPALPDPVKESARQRVARTEDEPPRSAARAALPERPSTSPEALAELYREAHRAHFVAQDYAAALAGWTRYLEAASPDAQLLLEARFNRGVALVRLGRSAEAKLALRPFAEGDYGGYRRQEARQLLEQLPQAH